MLDWVMDEQLIILDDAWLQLVFSSSTNIIGSNKNLCCNG